MPHPWQKKIHNGYMKKVARFPRRERLLVRQALQVLEKRTWEMVMYWSPESKGRKNHLNGNYQWLDFVVELPHKRLGVLILRPHWGSSGPHRYQTDELHTKQAFLEKKGLPYLVLHRDMSQQEYEIHIELWIRKETKNYEKQIVSLDK